MKAKPTTSVITRDDGSLPYVTTSHTKAETHFITLSREQVENVLSAGSSLSSGFFTALFGIDVAVLITLNTVPMSEQLYGIYWIAFIASIILTLFFGLLCLKDEIRKSRYRKALLKDPETTPTPWPKDAASNFLDVLAGVARKL